MAHEASQNNFSQYITKYSINNKYIYIYVLLLTSIVMNAADNEHLLYGTILTNNLVPCVFVIVDFNCIYMYNSADETFAQKI